MDSVVENDTLPTHWKLGQNDSIELLEFIFPDGALLLKQKGALAPSADQTMQPEHYTMDQILKYMRASGFYGVPPDSTSSSRSKRKGKGKGKEKYEEEWIGGSDCPALAAEASTKREGSLARFFNNVLRKAKAACDTINYRSWTATTSEEPLKGGDAIRKPDITSFFTNDLSCWQTVATFCEVKNRDGPQSEKSSYIEIGGKASHLLYTQDSRHSAISIRMLGRCMYLTIFDRGGSISTCPVDIHKNPLEFLRILIGVSSCSFATLGFDQSMEWRTAQRNGKDVAYKLLTIKQGSISRTIRLVKVLFISDNIHGRGTTVWEGLMKIPNSDTRIAEKVVVKDSWIDPLRKYTEGMILHMLENAGVQGVPKMIHEQQVEMAHPKSHAAKINSSTHIIRSKLEARHIQSNYYYLRVLSRIISQPVGQLVTEVSCLGELFVALLDYTVAHKEALEKAGVLHRDVSLLNLLLAAIASSHGARSDYAEYMNHLSQGDMSKLTNRIKKLQRRGILADWGYAVPVVSTPETAEPPAPVTTSGLTPDHVPTSPILPPTQTEEEVPIDTVLVKIPNEPNLPVPISDLTENDNIVLAMGIDDLDSEDPRQTLDSNPLFRTGTWSWMAAELSMVGPGQPVSHTAQHDLESLFYVLLGLCVLLEKPLQVKSEKDLAACFDKFFNTSQPSVLKTITIQSDLTWHPHFVQHISEYFQPVVPLLDKLRKAIILPLAMDSSGRTLRKRDFSHQTVIQAIIQELYNLPDYAWTPYKTDSNGAIVQVKDDDGDPVAESESDSGEMVVVDAPTSKSSRQLLMARSRQLAPGIGRFSRSQAAARRGLYKGLKKSEKPTPEEVPSYKEVQVGGEKNGSTRLVPTSKAPRFYPAEDVRQPKKSRKSPKAAKLRSSIVPGTVLILLAGRFRGKRVVFLKQLDSGLLLVTGPYKINGVPLRRVNQAYVIATSTRIDLESFKVDPKINDTYFAKTATKGASSAEAEFFSEGKPKPKEPFPEAKSADQKEVDKVVIAAVQKQENLAKYLKASFGLSKGQYPHQMVF